MEFIHQLFGVVDNVKVIILCDKFLTSRKLLENFIHNYHAPEDIIKQNDRWVAYFSNDNSISAYPSDDLALCGVRGDIVITDLDKENSKFREIILPTLVASRGNQGNKLKKFIYNPETKQIFSF